MRVLRRLMLALITPAAFAQGPASLPPNYKPVLENADILVQRVHYGPHEFVPMHDHPAVTTVYVYLNNSGIVDIQHDGAQEPVVHRPPTHTGAFRISPGSFERHSIQNTSDLPSDFLRIELKVLPVNSLPAEFRGEAPKAPFSFVTETPYDNPALRVERTICASVEKCTLISEESPSVVVIVPLKPTHEPADNPAIWLPANKVLSDLKSLKAFNGLAEHETELLRIVLLKH